MVHGSGQRSERSAAVSAAPTRTAVWTAVAYGALALWAAAVVAHHHYQVQVRLSWDTRLPATTVLALMAAVGLVSALVGRRREALGLVGLASVSFGAALSWLLLTEHRLAGPVVLPVADRHGFHLGDAVALIPAAVGLALTARLGWVLWRGLRSRTT